MDRLRLILDRVAGMILFLNFLAFLWCVVFGVLPTDWAIQMFVGIVFGIVAFASLFGPTSK